MWAWGGVGLLNQGLFTQLCVQFRKDYISCPSKYLMNSHEKNPDWLCLDNLKTQRIALMFSLTIAYKQCMDLIQSDKKVRVGGNNLIWISFSTQPVTNCHFCTSDEDISIKLLENELRCTQLEVSNKLIISPVLVNNWNQCSWKENEPEVLLPDSSAVILS